MNEKIFNYCFYPLIIILFLIDSVINLPILKYKLYILTLIGIVMLYRLLLNFDLSLFKKNILIIIICLNSLITYLWSIDQKTTFVGSLGLIIITIIALYMIKFIKKNDILNILAFTFILIAIINVISILYFPQISVSIDVDGRYEMAYKGIFIHRNVLGLISAISCLFCMYLINKNSYKKILGILFLIINIYLIFLSKSVTSEVLVFIMIVLFYFQSKSHSNKMIIISTILLFLFDILLLRTNLFNSIVSGKLNRDITFTGRTLIWEYSWNAIKDRFFNGYGYNAFWSNNPYSYYYVRSILGVVGHAHNGYLDIMLNFGMIGFIPYCLLIYNIIKNNFKQHKFGIALCISNIFFIFLWSYNFMESRLIVPFSIIFLLQVLFYNFIISDKIYQTNSWRQ